MAIPIKEAVIKYRDYLTAVDEIKKLLEDEGFQIIASNDFELGAEWIVSYDNEPVAEMMWNVPYMLSFKPLVSQEEVAYETDLVKSIKMWQLYLNDMAKSIINTKSDKNEY